MPTVNVATADVGVDTQRIDILQVSNLDPDDGSTGLAPGYPISFDLKNSARPHILDFEDDNDDLWERCTYADGWTQALWNSGGSDEWDIYDDNGNMVYRAQDQATSLANDRSLYLPGLVGAWADVVVRIKWFTGATAGVVLRVADSSYYRATYGPYCAAFEIDSGGLRRVTYRVQTRTVNATSAFTPTDGEWYWLRVQQENISDYYCRAKVWQGGRLDEPDTWDLAWAKMDYLYLSEQQCYGYGVRVHAGTAYFDDWEVWTSPSQSALSKLKVELNGEECTVANGKLAIWPNTINETPRSATRPVPQINDWHVEVNWSSIAQAIVESYDLDISYSEVTLHEATYEVSRIPGAWPIYDPDTESPSGDPDRMSYFGFEGSGYVVPLGVFNFFRTIFLLSFGSQDAVYSVAPLTFPTSCYEDFQWLLYTPYYTPVNGIYLIGHPIWEDVPSSLIPAEVVEEVVPADVIPLGALERIFPASVVPQAYMRRDFPSSVIVGYVFHYEGMSSGVVGAKILKDLDGSGLSFQQRVGTVVHVNVLTDSTFTKLQQLGVGFSLAIINRVAMQSPADVGVDTDTWTIVDLPWHEASWDYRVRVYVDPDYVDSDLTDIDILITEANMPSGFWSHVKSDASDVRVTASDGTVLYRDLVAWDYSGHTMQLRVRTDLSSSITTVLCVYYGNSGASESNNTATYGKLASDATSRRLRHYYTMEQDPTSGAPQLTDRTAGAVHMTSANMESGDRIAGYGDLGYAWDFDGSDEKAETLTTGSVNVGLYYQTILEAWVNADDITAEGCILAIIRYNAGQYQNIGLSIGSDKKPFAWWYNSTTRNSVVAASAISGWTHVVACFMDGTNDVILWINGALSNQNLNITQFSATNTELRLLAAATRHPGTLALQYFLKGKLDNCRMIWDGTTNWNFPSAEIVMRYANESDPATFYSCPLGEESKP